jgi:multicomponent Na+:H+ antiporter subunit F
MIIAAIIALCVSVAMLLARALFSKTVFDKILAVNLIGTNVVLLILFLNKEYIDIALVYALLNFVGTIAFLKFFKFSGKK